ncbi:chemotaxis protein CheX [Nocardioidaceae bacterium]|nr:chemotaxis protein CheX [Nocardioidaceae bacterium]
MSIHPAPLDPGVDPTVAASAPTSADLEALLVETWESYLSDGGPAIPWPTAPVDDETVGWSASVCFDGTWRCLVALEMQGTTAEAATRELLALDGDEEITDEDISDAVGELVNILGGAVKSIVAATSSLSLPVVAAGRVALPRHSTRLCDVAVRWHGRPVRVHLHAVGSTADTGEHTGHTGLTGEVP